MISRQIRYRESYREAPARPFCRFRVRPIVGGSGGKAAVKESAAMAPFELEEPGSLSEALGLLDPEDPAVRPIAGGTALMLMMKSGLYRPQRLVSLRKVAPGLADIGVGPDGALEIGAMVRLSELQRSAVIRDFAPSTVSRQPERRQPGQRQPDRRRPET
jgi:molybdopterin-dependent oxidoreductase-like protein